MKLTKTQTIKKIEIAIDKMIDLQDAGLGNRKITEVLDLLNQLKNIQEAEGRFL